MLAAVGQRAVRAGALEAGDWRLTRTCREAALTVLADMPGKEVDDDLAARLPQGGGQDRQVLIELAGRRRIEAAAAALAEGRGDPDAQVRAAALTALGATIEPGDLAAA